MTYTVLAWIPGTSKFIVKEGDLLGFYDSTSKRFEPDDGRSFLEAAALMGYRRIGPYQVLGSELAQLSRDLVNW